MTKRSDFGRNLEKMLKERGLDQADLARSLSASNNTELTSSRTVVNRNVVGARKPSSGWIEIVANTLGLSEDERRALYLARVRDAGFKL